jgi:hypothetical protein
MQIPGRNAASALENAAAQLRSGMEAARRSRQSLPELRAREREILRTWAENHHRIFQTDPTLSLSRRQEHGEHAVGFDPETSCWWKMTQHNTEFGDEIRFEGYVDLEQPSLVVSQPDIAGTPATQDQMENQMKLLGFLPLPNARLGKPNSISFYHPKRGIALFDAHPGNFFQSAEATLPIDGIISHITQPTEHAWLMDRVESIR